MTRPDINLSPVERAGRIVIEGAAAIVGIVLLAAAGPLSRSSCRSC